MCYGCNAAYFRIFFPLAVTAAAKNILYGENYCRFRLGIAWKKAQAIFITLIMHLVSSIEIFQK